ncbi:hypothetical protein LBMAG52_03830 [Planctomycetia bacterium]|nr:hypothetical protein LBMAG52_03830 [Planctomycetia bacterium]
MIALGKLAVPLVVSLVAIGSSGRAHADDAGIEFFEKKIRPLLVAHCSECHAADAKKLGGGLLLDSRDGVRKGGDTGAAVVPGKPDESLLIKAVRYTDGSVKMPPKGKLPAAAIADLEEWIKRGAPDPRDKPVASKANDSWEETMRVRARWWSLQPVQNVEVPRPQAADWSDHPVDRFVLARLEKQGLKPAEPVEPRTLVRRLSLVLTGLPPTSEQVAAFLRERESIQPATAYEKLVDSLLDSPHFGERWARHWMDVVRFTETHGNEWNYEVHHAWRYRDYLTRAFNADVPFDQFIREHIAGDLLPKPRWNEKERFNESIIGTGFYRFGEVNHDDCISLPSIGYDLADNQIDTLTKAFQATTVACARCHNHKLDAVSMQDYYAMLGILRSSRLVSHCIDAPDVNAKLMQRLTELKIELRKELAAVWLQETSQLARYMPAALAKRANRPDAAELAAGLDAKRLEKWIAVVAAEKMPIEDPFEPLRVLATATMTDPAAVASEWQKQSERYTKEDRDRTDFNRTQFETFADFRAGSLPAFSQITGKPPAEPTARDGVDPTSRLGRSLAFPDGWHIGGQALRVDPRRGGDFALHPDGDALVRAVLPAGSFTHAVSDKLNGTLRSPVLPLGKKNISFQVLGQRSSAVRLVSNNCQLNYKNYRALTSADLHWETFSPPDERDSLRTYAELMTMFDNPKFPDQLAALGGDKDNYKLPWDKAAENPRSYFGITRIVLHDCPEPPRAEVAHLRPLFAGNGPTSLADVAARYATVIEAALRAWSEDRATDEDARWLDALLRRELLANQVGSSPRLTELAKEYRQTEAELALPRVVAGVGESGSGYDQPIFTRGDVARPSETAPRRFLEVLSASRDSFVSAGSGRMELADRIASSGNPLTARVIVNRIWHHLFGTGLVRTVDDFGHVGELPSHSELLDHLSTRFVAEGWSMKKLIRSLVLTRTFQLSNQPSAESREVDPQNRLLQHFPARRLEAEAIRDSILAASGRLDRTLYGPSVQPFRDKDYADRRLFAGPLDGHGRRSIYIKNNLMEGPKFLEAFNFPGGKVTQGRRDVTNVPAQALALLNDPFVLQQADVWAKQLVARSDDSIGARIDVLFQTALNRSPADDERQRFERTMLELAELHQVPPSGVLTSQLVWCDLAHAIFNLKEFIYIP